MLQNLPMRALGRPRGLLGVSGRASDRDMRHHGRDLFANAELPVSLLWLALSIFVVVQGRELGIGIVRDPGAGFLLFWIGLLMCSLSSTLIARAARDAGGPSLASLWAGARWGKVLIVVADLTAYAILIEPLGFLLATTSLLLILLRAIDPLPWAMAFSLAFGTTLSIWWMVKRLLLIQLPSGVFEIG